MKGAREGGFTMLEVGIMGLITAVLLVMITQSVASLSSTRAELRQHSNIGNFADRVARQMENDITFASRVFIDTQDDNAYLRGLSLWPSLVTAESRLPALTSKGFFEPDPPGQRETGNLVALGMRGQRLSVVIAGETQEEYLVQTLSIVVYGPLNKGDCDRDLLRWVSEPMIAYWDVEQIADLIQRRAVLQKLYDRGLRYAWDVTQPRQTGLFTIEPAGQMAPLPMSAKVRGQEDTDNSRPFARRAMRLAGNHTLHGIQVPAFAHAEGHFPDGFEVKIDGTGNGKLVLLRFVVESTVQNKRRVLSEVRRMVCTDG